MNANTSTEPAFLNRLAWNLRWSDRRRSTDAAERALALASDAAALRTEGARACRTLAWQAKWRGDFDRATDFALRCEAAVGEGEAPELRGECYSILGVIHYSRNRLDLAQGATRRGLTLRGLPDGVWIDLMTTKSTIQRYAGHAGKSGLTLLRARDRATGADLARVEHNLARLMAQHDEPACGRRHATTAIELAERHDNRVVLPYACEIAGSTAASLGRADEASGHFRRGIGLAVEDDDMRVLCQLLLCSAAFEASRGDLEGATDQLHYGARIAEDMTYPLWQKRFALALAEVLEAGGDLAGALRAHKQAWTLQESLRDECIGADFRSG